jgi:membrane-associated protease RseP (regulator of RpoE activity)
MKKTLIALACAAVAPLAFAQTSTTTTTTGTEPGTSTSTSETTTTSSSTKPSTSTSTETTTTTTYTEGTVSTFTPGKTIVVRKVGVTDPITYAIGKTVTYVNRAGKTIEASMVRPGVPVHVYYDNAGGTQTVTKVVVDQD